MEICVGYWGEEIGIRIGDRDKGTLRRAQDIHPPPQTNCSRFRKKATSKPSPPSFWGTKLSKINLSLSYLSLNFIEMIQFTFSIAMYQII